MQGGKKPMDGVVCQVWIGDMSLHTTHSQCRSERASAAIFNGIA